MRSLVETILAWLEQHGKLTEYLDGFLTNGQQTMKDLIDKIKLLNDEIESLYQKSVDEFAAKGKIIQL